MTVTSIAGTIPHVGSPLDDQFESDEKRYDWLMGVRANYLLLGDKSTAVPVNIIPVGKKLINTNLKWLNRGELIAGSFMSSAVQGSNVKFEDIDIYFKCEQDAKDFMKLNPLPFFYENKVMIRAGNYNLIFGIHYDSPEDLVMHFDIRACSIAFDPGTGTVYAVVGALRDCVQKHVVYNPVPHNTTIARLIKYIEKGFLIDPYQRLFLAELIKSDQYNTDLELSTGYRATSKK